jgi:CBS domain-containing protein
MPEGDSLMQLAIFWMPTPWRAMPALLQRARQCRGAWPSTTTLCWRALPAAIDNFGGPASAGGAAWLGDEGRAISLKKEGIFPIVHGVRSLALAGACRPPARPSALRRWWSAAC